MEENKMTFVLILTIAGAFNSSPIFILSVPGFQSEENCMGAARTWLKEQSRRDANAVCARQ